MPVACTGTTPTRPRRGTVTCTSVLLAMLVVLVGSTRAVASAPAGAGEAEGARRVLVVSVPTLTWELVVDEQPPALTGLLRRAAVASASVRSIGPETTAGEGYATIGAGNRAAVAERVAGSAFAATAVVNGESAAAVLAGRSGTPVDGAAVVHLGMPAIGRINDRLLYGAETGSLGSALADGGRRVAVVANADLELDIDLRLEPMQVHREAALAVADGAGVVPEGVVGPELLQADRSAPFGLRLDPDAVVGAVEAASDADVVLVELSDLDRADASAPLAARSVATATRRSALAHTDALVARLLDGVDLERDLVVLIAPTAPRGPAQLTVAALAGAGVGHGLAVSGTTGRPGYVTLPDVAPTILDALGVEPPSAMTGTAMSATGGDASGSATWQGLASDNDRARFRQTATAPLVVTFIVVVVAGLALAVLALVVDRPRLRRAAAFVQLVALAAPLVTFLMGLVREDPLGVAGSTFAVFAVAVGVAALARLAAARMPWRNRWTGALLPPLLLLGATAAVLLLDGLTGSRLQIDTAFGYDAIVAGRFTGYGNLASGMLTVSAVAATTGVWALLSVRRGAAGQPSRAVLAAIAVLLAATVVIMGLPGLGRDVGGVLTAVPGFTIVVALLSGARLGWRRLLLLGMATVVVLGAFGAVDVARAEEERGHLGRLIARTLGDEGLTGLATVLERKANANLFILTSSVWAYVIPVAVAFLAFLVWRPPQTVAGLMRLPGGRALLVGSVVTCVLAAAVNDSGIAIPAIMLSLLLPYLAHLALSSPGAPDAAVPGPRPSGAATATGSTT